MTIEDTVDESGMSPRQRAEFERERKTEELRQRYEKKYTCPTSAQGGTIWACQDYDSRPYCTRDCDYAKYRKSFRGRLRRFFGI